MLKKVSVLLILGIVSVSCIGFAAPKESRSRHSPAPRIHSAPEKPGIHRDAPPPPHSRSPREQRQGRHQAPREHARPEINHPEVPATNLPPPERSRTERMPVKRPPQIGPQQMRQATPPPSVSRVNQIPGNYTPLAGPHQSDYSTQSMEYDENETQPGGAEQFVGIVATILNIAGVLK